MPQTEGGRENGTFEKRRFRRRRRKDRGKEAEGARTGKNTEHRAEHEGARTSSTYPGEACRREVQRKNARRLEPERGHDQTRSEARRGRQIAEQTPGRGARKPRRPDGKPKPETEKYGT